MTHDIRSNLDDLQQRLIDTPIEAAFAKIRQQVDAAAPVDPYSGNYPDYTVAISGIALRQILSAAHTMLCLYSNLSKNHELLRAKYAEVDQAWETSQDAAGAFIKACKESKRLIDGSAGHYMPPESKP